MSLNVYLISKEKHTNTSSGIFIRENGQTKEITEEEWNLKYPNKAFYRVEQKKETNIIYCNSITHNLTDMAEEAGIYEALWRPYRLKSNYNISEDDYEKQHEFEDNNVVQAKELIDILNTGLNKLLEDPNKYKKFNPDNGWGSYEGLVEFLINYLEACHNYPESVVKVSR